MEEQEAKRILFARFLYSWILISIAFFVLWSTGMINTKLYAILTILTTLIMIVWLMKIISM